MPQIGSRHGANSRGSGINGGYSNVGGAGRMNNASIGAQIAGGGPSMGMPKYGGGSGIGGAVGSLNSNSAFTIPKYGGGSGISGGIGSLGGYGAMPSSGGGIGISNADENFGGRNKF